MSLSPSRNCEASEMISPEEYSTEEIEEPKISIGRKHMRVSDCTELANPPTAEYRKMRKRQQNRESEARARARKKELTQQLTHRIKELTAENDKLLEDAEALKAESAILRRNLAFYRTLAASKSPASL